MLIQNRKTVIETNIKSQILPTPITDSYTDKKSAGNTIGSPSNTGVIRKGIDKEKLISIDNGALRFQPLIKAGWGRQGIAYGPYNRSNGLAFATFILNGHNTSQADPIEPFKKRMHQWLIGSETETPKQRFLAWLKSPQKWWMGRRLWWWIRSAPELRKFFPLTKLDENLAVGWFPQEVPSNPLETGNGFIVHATGTENGELWARIGDNLLSSVKGLQNLQTYYVVILREKGAAYYAASVPNAHGLGDYPNMRLLGIDAFNDDPTVYAGIYQSVLGQIGFRIDTRVYGAQVTEIPTLSTWYGTAQTAHSLVGDGNLDGIPAEKGGKWQVWQGNYQQTPQGTIAQAGETLAVLDCETAPGVIHLLVETPAKATEIALLWRVKDQNNYWSLQASGDKCRLRLRHQGKWETLAVSDLWSLQTNATNSLQISDRGDEFSLYLNGKLLFNKQFVDSRMQTATGIGIGSTEANQNQYFRALEAHPLNIPIPAELNLGSPWIPKSRKAIITEDFAGSVQDLVGKITTTGEKQWHKQIGTGIIELTGDSSAKVRADAKNPNPNRAAYTLEWDYPEFAEIEVEITPPGTRRGQREKGRGGLILWQDSDNYIIVNNWLDDVYGGASISTFFHLHGFEELYDAVWTNVGKRVRWGVPHQLRIAFDGMNYLICVNNEPVLYRALTDVYPNTTPLAINRVGIVANWEWGNDTGSIFKNFVARASSH